MAGSKKDAFETALLQHIFQNAAIANVGNAAGLQPAGAAGSFYIALFTTANTDAAAGTEASYTGYARVAVARSSAGWTIAGGACSNAALITFGACTAGTNTIVGFAICTGSTVGTADAIYWGDLSASLSVSAGITPEFAIGALVVNED